MAKSRVRRESVVQPLDQSYRIIPLTQGQVAKVSAHRYEELSKSNWFSMWANGPQSFYAATNIARPAGGFKLLAMHTAILNTPKGMRGDHINGDTLDNRDENLRICTIEQNCQNHKINKRNKSGVSGVYLSKGRNTWGAWIGAEGKRVHLGFYRNKDTAIEARLRAERLLHGDFSRIAQSGTLTACGIQEIDRYDTCC